MRDALLTLAMSFRDNRTFIDNFQPPSRSCSTYRSSIDTYQWEDGQKLIQNIDERPFNGTSGPIQFDEIGMREKFHFQVEKLECEKQKNCEFQRIALWDDGRIHLTRDMREITMRISHSIQDKRFVVITRLGMPFLREVESSGGLTGNDRYEGFSKDIMDEIAKRLRFKYVIELVKDKSYGNIDKKTEKWNGMVKEILDRVRLIFF